MKLILLAGFAQAGKDTTAELLVNHYGYTRFGFADEVKKIAAQRTGLPIELFSYPEGKKQKAGSMTLREHCIEIGESGRKQDPEFWGKKVADSIRSSGVSKVVISDWRNLPELFALQKAFSTAEIYPIRIRRSGQYVSSVPDMTEYNLNGFPFVLFLENDGIQKELLLNKLKNFPFL